MKKLLTIVVALLVAATTTFATEYTKAKDDPLTEYVADQLAETREVFIQHYKNENTFYHILDNVKKPVTNEQKKAYNIIQLKYQYIYEMYYTELNEAVLGIEEAFPEFVMDNIDVDNIDETELKNEYIVAVKTIALFIEPVVSKYEKELVKLEKLVKVYEKM